MYCVSGCILYVLQGIFESPEQGISYDRVRMVDLGNSDLQHCILMS